MVEGVYSSFIDMVLPHHGNKDIDDDIKNEDDGGDMQPVLKKTLFWELLWRVRRIKGYRH